MRFSFWIILVLLIASCKPDSKTKDFKIVIDTSQQKVVILCEGNFLWGNAGLDVYYPKSGLVVLDVYKKQNGGKPLGDVLQSGMLQNGLLWLVLNNSGKIVALDPQKFTWQKAISGLKSPRYMVEANGRFWITDIYDNHISIADTNGTTVSKKLSCKGWSEQLLAFNSRVYVANANGFVYVFDALKLTQTDSILVPKGSKWICKDKNNKIWVLSSDSGKSYLSAISPLSHKVEKQFLFAKGISASSLVLSKNGDSLFYLANGVFGMSISASALSVAPIYTPNLNENIYGLSVNPFSGNLYLCNAKDYISKGSIIVVSSRGEVLQQLESGIIPSSCMFYY